MKLILKKFKQSSMGSDVYNVEYTSKTLNEFRYEATNYVCKNGGIRCEFAVNGMSSVTFSDTPGWLLDNEIESAGCLFDYGIYRFYLKVKR